MLADERNESEARWRLKAADIVPRTIIMKGVSCSFLLPLSDFTGCCQKPKSPIPLTSVFSNPKRSRLLEPTLLISVQIVVY